MRLKNLLKIIDFSRDGWVPVVVVDHRDGEVLMLASMDQAALEKTLQTGKMHYLSRTRGKLWLKGESSGHYQLVKEIYVDCDPANRLLFRVEQLGGAACHTGHRSCFHRRVDERGELEAVGKKIFRPEQVYGRRKAAAGKKKGRPKK